jgi:hypothetical protein
MMMVPVTKNRQSKMEWPDPESEGRNRRTRNENCRQTGNQKKNTELSHGHAPRNVDGRATLTEPASSIRWIRVMTDDVNNYVDDLAPQHATTNRILADLSPVGTR